MSIIECRQVSKSFKKQVVFDGLDFAIDRPGIYGLLGRNGAGKTTLLNLLTARYLPDRGEILLHGEPAYENEKQLLSICYMADYVSGFQGLKVGEIMRRAKAIYPNFNEEYKDRIMGLFELNDKMVYGSISKGQATAVGIIVGLASGCETVLFDEIYSGLDAVARQYLYELLLEDYAQSNRTFILSTHLIEEMDRLFTDVIFMKNGEIVLSKPYEETMASAYILMGRSEAIASITDLELLSSREHPPMEKAVCWGNLSAEQLSRLAKLQVEVKPASLQELFVAMVS